MCDEYPADRTDPECQRVIRELLDDIEITDAGHAAATAKALELWAARWGDDVLVSVPGVGEICASATRAWWGEGTQLPSAKRRFWTNCARC